MNYDEVLLAPMPRQLEWGESEHRIQNGRLIVLSGPDPQHLLLAARQLQSALETEAGVAWEIAAGTGVPADLLGVSLNVVPAAFNHPQAYDLRIDGERISITASTPAGLFYGTQTLCQLLAQLRTRLPTLRCTDWPDFATRGVMLDISRDKVPTRTTLMNLIDLLASLKINQIQLYTEHTFAYRRHPVVWADASPLDGADILALDRYCQERFIELVPNQNSFGHLRRWLIHEPYRELAEAPDGCDTVWGRFDEPFSLYPGDPASLEFLRSLYDELLPHFSSRQFNVGCDETVDLGQGRSRALAQEIGVGKIYLDFLLAIHREVSARGHIMQFWGDIVVKHPDLVPHLPRDLIALVWGYEADHPFDDECSQFAAAGIPFYVCPGTSAWNSIAGRTTNAVENLRYAAESGLRHGAGGYIITDWGDNGHWQPLSVSYIPLLYGAALAWSVGANRELDLAATASRVVFQDAAGVMGKIACDLGDLYRLTGAQLHNRTLFFELLQQDPPWIEEWLHSGVVADVRSKLCHVLAELDGIVEHLPEVELRCQDAVLVEREFAWAAEMIRHACWRAIWLDGRSKDSENLALRTQLQKDNAALASEFEALWLARNRVGGFTDSLARLERSFAAYYPPI